MFSGNRAWLSNFYPCWVTYDGREYSSVEHAYQAAKTLDLTLRKRIQVEVTPAKAKRLGRRVELRPDWLDIRVKIMRELVWQKFSLNTKLGKLLIEEDPQRLVEWNTWHDNFWGICTCKNCPARGENQLGKLLIGCRQRLLDWRER